MAIIRKIEKSKKEFNGLHRTDARCDYSVGSDGDLKIVQLNTYGSNDRMVTEHASQTLQITKDTAEELVRILRHEFDLD